jgi:hypothetical protein
MRSLRIGTALVGLTVSLLLQSCSQNSPPPGTQTTPTSVTQADSPAPGSLPASSSNVPVSPQPVSTIPFTPAPRIIIDSPVGESVGLTVTFRWHVEGGAAGDAYRYKILLDKGQDACDGGVEEGFDAKTETCLRVKLSPSRYTNESADYAIQATDSKGTTYCAPGGRIRVTPKLRPSPPCKRST